MTVQVFSGDIINLARLQNLSVHLVKVRVKKNPKATGHDSSKNT